MADNPRHRGEDGIAMVTVVVLASVMLTLAVSILAIGTNANETTTRDRNWNAALAVAEGAAERLFVTHGRAVFEQTSATVSNQSGSVPGGVFERGRVSLCTAAGVDGCPQRGYVRVEAVGAAPNSLSSASRRRIVTYYGPERIFTYALFSFGTLTLQNQSNVGAACTKPVNDVVGDVFANGEIVVGNGQQIQGSAISATRAVSLGAGACLKVNANSVGGSAITGGFCPASDQCTQNYPTSHALRLANGARVEGDAELRADCPATGALAGAGSYRLVFESSSSRILGSAFGPASAPTGGTPDAGYTSTCKSRITSVAMPPLPTTTQARTDFATRYCPTTPSSCAYEHASVAAFNTWLTSNVGNVRGFHRVTGAPGDTIDLTSRTINGEFVLRAEGPSGGEGPKITVGSASGQFYNGPGTIAGGEVLVQIITNNTSGGATCTGGVNARALTLENGLNFITPSASDKPATLFYALGCARAGNNVTVPGALWALGIDAANSFRVEYNPGVESAPGVGGNRLTRTQTVELKP